MIDVGRIFRVNASKNPYLSEGFYRIVLNISRSPNIFLFPLQEPPTQEDKRGLKLRKSEQLASSGVKLREKEHIRRPFCVPRNVFNGLIEEKQAILIEEYVVRERNPERSLSPKSKLLYERNKKLLLPLTDPDILFRMLECNQWSRFISARVEKVKHYKDFKTRRGDKKEVNADDEINPRKRDSAINLMLRRLLSRFFECGMDLETACTPRLANCGTAPREDRHFKAKQGRKNRLVKTKHAPDKEGVNSRDFEASAIQFWELQSDSEKERTYAAQYRDFRSKYGLRAVTFLADGTQVWKEYDEYAFITKGQYRTIIENHKGKLELKKIFSSGKVLLRYRSLLSDARNRITSPGQCFIIDSTIGDVYLVTAFDRRLLIGRPVIYVIIDAFSSLIVGLHVCLEGPNVSEAKIALARALGDKVDWLNYLGLPKLLGFYPQACRPTTLFSDRGELHSEEGRKIAGSINYIASIAAPYRADWKSLVERFFGYLNQLVIHWIPGAVRERARERGKRDVRLDAILTLYEFTKLLAIRCADWNAHKDMSKHVSASISKAGIEASPIGFWNYGIKNLHGTPLYYSRDEIISRFMPHLPITLNRRGVFHGDLRYVADWMEDHPAILGPAFGLGSEGIMYRNPDDPYKGYCEIAGEKQLRPLQLLFENRSTDKYTFEDIVDFRALNQLNADERQQETRPVADAFKRAEDDIVQGASAKTKQAHRDSPMSKTRRVANIKKNRADATKLISGSERPETTEPEENPDETTSQQFNSSNTDSSAADNAIANLISQWKSEDD